MPNFFDPYTLKGVTLRNRIAVSPMCQYMAEDGLANDWHHVHYSGLARGGSGLVVVEATGVSPEGRITPAVPGPVERRPGAGLAPTVAAIKPHGADRRHPDRPRRPQGQRQPALGRRRPHPRGRPEELADDRALGDRLRRRPAAGPARDDQGRHPARPRQDFVAAAERARDIGFRVARAALRPRLPGQSFLSPTRTSVRTNTAAAFENRSRFLIETLARRAQGVARAPAAHRPARRDRIRRPRRGDPRRGDRARPPVQGGGARPDRRQHGLLDPDRADPVGAGFHGAGLPRGCGARPACRRTTSWSSAMPEQATR